MCMKFGKQETFKEFYDAKKCFFLAFLRLNGRVWSLETKCLRRRRLIKERYFFANIGIFIAAGKKETSVTKMRIFVGKM